MAKVPRIAGSLSVTPIDDFQRISHHSFLVRPPGRKNGVASLATRPRTTVEFPDARVRSARRTGRNFLVACESATNDDLPRLPHSRSGRRNQSESRTTNFAPQASTATARAPPCHPRRATAARAARLGLVFANAFPKSGRSLESADENKNFNKSLNPAAEPPPARCVPRVYEMRARDLARIP